MSQSIKRTAIRALPWALIESGGLAILNLGSIVALARLLAPADFGRAAVALSLITFLQFVVTAPFSESLVQRQALDRMHLTTAFTTMLAVGLLALAVTTALASPIALLYRDPNLANLVLLGSLLYPIEALTAVPTSLLTRRLGLKSLAIRTLSARAIAVAVSAVMAATGFGATSLIAGPIVGNAIGVAIIWGATDFRPRFGISRAHLRELVHFGGATLLEGFLWNLTSRAFVAIIGYIHGTQMLGYLSMAFHVVDAISVLLNGITRRFFLALFSGLQGDLVEVRTTFLQVSKASTALAAPLFLIVAAFPSHLLGRVFGPQWLPASDLLQILAVASAISYCFPAVPSLLKALGRPYQAVILAGTGALFSLVLAPMTASLAIVYAALAWMSRQAVTVPLALYLISSNIGVSPRTYLGIILSAVAPALFLIVTLKSGWVFFSDLPIELRLGIPGIVGVAVFFATLYLIDGQAIIRIYRRAKTPTRE